MLTKTITRYSDTITPDMLTRETLDQRENPGGDGTHKMMY